MYSLQFSIPYSVALNAVKYRVGATKEHDIAEKFEDIGDLAKASIHWDKAEKLIERHFEVLLKGLKSK